MTPLALYCSSTDRARTRSSSFARLSPLDSPARRPLAPLRFLLSIDLAALSVGRRGRAWCTTTASVQRRVRHGRARGSRRALAHTGNAVARGGTATHIQGGARPGLTRARAGTHGHPGDLLASSSSSHHSREIIAGRAARRRTCTRGRYWPAGGEACTQCSASVRDGRPAGLFRRQL